jgi:hypothetical protein
MGGRKWTMEERKELLEKVQNSNYDYSEMIDHSCNTKTTFRCRKHDLKFVQRNTEAYGSKSGCPECKKENSNHRQRKTVDQIISEFTNVHGDRYGYSLVDYHNWNTPVVIICKRHGKFKQLPSTHKKGGNCPSCSMQSRRESQFYPKACFINKFEANNKHGFICDYETYMSYSDLVKVFCPRHSETFYVEAYRAMKGVCSCPKCKTLIHTDYDDLSYLNDDDKNKTCMIYHIRFNDRFDKVGITLNDVKTRFKNMKSDSGLQYEVITEYVTTLQNAVTLESKIKSDMIDKGLAFKIHDLKKLGIGGWTECYPLDSFKLSDYI